ncbi:MAG: hydrogenase expression/formation protein HypE [archaeon]
MKEEKKVITLAEGAGGSEMDQLINSFGFSFRSNWKNCDSDSATYELENKKKLFFTTDSYVVDPIFFPGGNIGHLAFCGTVNDILVKGGIPIGIALSLVIEEGFSTENLSVIINTIKELSARYNVPIVTGDTKVMPKGKIDKIIINTAAVGISDRIFSDVLNNGDAVIISGGIGEHAIALLSKRFDYETNVITDSKPLIMEFNDIRKYVKIAKDPTRGGIAASLNEICEQNNVGISLDEDSIPALPQVKKVAEMLGINLFNLACEGRAIVVASQENAKKILELLQKYNKYAAIIGKIDNSKKVILNTAIGKSILPKPTGRIVPRIC